MVRGLMSAAAGRGYSETIVAAACLGLVWLGDALIYIVFRLHLGNYNVGVTSVAILL